MEGVLPGGLSLQRGDLKGIIGDQIAPGYPRGEGAQVVVVAADDAVEVGDLHRWLEAVDVFDGGAHTFGDALVQVGVGEVVDVLADTGSHHVFAPGHVEVSGDRGAVDLTGADANQGLFHGVVIFV